jgi:hypothetical protein
VGFTDTVRGPGALNVALPTEIAGDPVAATFTAAGAESTVPIDSVVVCGWLPVTGIVSGFGIAEIVNGLSETETFRLIGDALLEGAIVSIAEAPPTGRELVVGVSVRVPELCPVVPAVPEIFSQGGTPDTANANALPSLELIVTVFGCGSPRPW